MDRQLVGFQVFNDYLQCIEFGFYRCESLSSILRFWSFLLLTLLKLLSMQKKATSACGCGGFVFNAMVSADLEKSSVGHENLR